MPLSGAQFLGRRPDVSCALCLAQTLAWLLPGEQAAHPDAAPPAEAAALGALWQAAAAAAAAALPPAELGPEAAGGGGGLGAAPQVVGGPWGLPVPPPAAADHRPAVQRALELLELPPRTGASSPLWPAGPAPWPPTAAGGARARLRWPLLRVLRRWRRAERGVRRLRALLDAAPPGLWWGFAEPRMESAYVAWRLERVPNGRGPLAAFGAVMAVGIVATTARLTWCGISRPLLKAMAGMLWLMSPMFVQFCRLGLLRPGSSRSSGGGRGHGHGSEHRQQQQQQRAGDSEEEGGNALALGPPTPELRTAGGHASRDASAAVAAGSSSSTAAAGAAAAPALLTRRVPRPFAGAALAWYDTLTAACCGLVASLLGLVTYTCSRPELDVRQVWLDDVGFVFGIFMTRAVFAPLATQLRLWPQLLASAGMAAVDVVHLHVLWRGAVPTWALVAAAAVVAVSNMALSGYIEVGQRREFLRMRAAATAEGKDG
ncbi:hypothetical protein TSOC_006463 [Tetrabaena socialis]|uniref:Uncharacterized protein n=1 Tax=Tetrabaena socialis TaxID=47790 RepID=A0A2J8A3K9_9CHLO|nr:hypothetical protein TSOC_006463 [Tetrabaena socialis]|eukprot:PNH07104.1 hypothetical protein TSOC_006463 [Tetrabaena socialis]